MTAEAETGVDSRAEWGLAIEMRTLSIVSQFEDGDFPFKVGRTEDEFPGAVVDTHFRWGEPGVVDGYYVLTPKGLMLHTVASEMRNGASVPYITSAVLRHASPEEYADLEEKINPINEKLLDELQLRDAMKLAGDY